MNQCFYDGRLTRGSCGGEYWGANSETGHCSWLFVFCSGRITMFTRKSITRAFSFLFVLALTFTTLGVTPVSAAPIRVVNKTADTNDGVCDADCSLREAIAVSAAGETIVFDPSLSGGMITLTSPLNINKNLNINGDDLPTHIGINGSNTMNVFIISNPVTVALRGISISSMGGRIPPDMAAPSLLPQPWSTWTR